MAGGYVQVDETPVNYLEPGHGRVQAGLSLDGQSSRGRRVFPLGNQPRHRLSGQCHSANLPARCSATATRPIARLPTVAVRAIELAGCWAHVRRKFYEAIESSPRTAGWIVRQIQHLYRIEAGLREHRAGPRLRQAVRAQSKPADCGTHRTRADPTQASGRHLPQSHWAGAIDYALGQWPTLTVYLDDGRVEIDNNLVENAIRPTAIGKKNWLFVGDADAGERSAIIYTVIESCRPSRPRPLRLLERCPHAPASHDQPPNPAKITSASCRPEVSGAAGRCRRTCGIFRPARAACKIRRRHSTSNAPAAMSHKLMVRSI
jgi:transposase